MKNIKKLRNQNQGFTIIEVLIVLAIAGLIMLIVFLAVPALQRTSRNTGRKNDIGRIGAAVTEYSSSQNGNLPTTGAQVTALAGTLSQYDTANISLQTASAAGTSAVTNFNNVVIVTGARCNANTTAAGQVVAGSTRQVAIQYAVETNNGGYLSSCQEV